MSGLGQLGFQLGDSTTILQMGEFGDGMKVGTVLSVILVECNVHTQT